MYIGHRRLLDYEIYVLHHVDCADFRPLSIHLVLDWFGFGFLQFVPNTSV